jgi:integrase/recombinase XerD
MTAPSGRLQFPPLPCPLSLPCGVKPGHGCVTSSVRIYVNPNTRRAYREAVRLFSAFCAEHRITDRVQVKPIHVAAFVEMQVTLHARPTVKLRLAALRMLFDWMVVGQVIPANPAHAVRGPTHSQRRGKTPVLQADEARTLIDAIDAVSLPGLRDRSLIVLMVYTFARVGKAAVSMRVEEYFSNTS